MHLGWLFVAIAASHAGCVKYNQHYRGLVQKSRADDGTVNEPADGEIEKIMVVDNETGITYNPYSRHHPGRHVCTSQKNVSVPVKTKQSFCKPVYKKYTERCNNNQLCTGVRLIYETEYRDVVTTKTTNRLVYVCCPGWVQVNTRSHGCNKPRCTTDCKNGGRCIKPDLCACAEGFTGRHCEHDVNECTEQKPCDQICHNTLGSYACECRENFILHTDGQSCRKEGEYGPGVEAKDLEFDTLNKRLSKLETMLGMVHDDDVALPLHPSSDFISKTNRSIENLSEKLTVIQGKLEEVEKYHDDVTLLKTKLVQMEKRLHGKSNDALRRVGKSKKVARSYS